MKAIFMKIVESTLFSDTDIFRREEEHKYD